MPMLIESHQRAERARTDPQAAPDLAPSRRERLGSASVRFGRRVPNHQPIPPSDPVPPLVGGPDREA